MSCDYSLNTIQLLSYAVGLGLHRDHEELSVPLLIDAIALFAHEVRGTVGRKGEDLMRAIVPHGLVEDASSQMLRSSYVSTSPIPHRDLEFSSEVKEVFTTAERICDEAKVGEVEPFHILRALIESADSDVIALLGQKGIDVANAKNVLRSILNS